MRWCVACNVLLAGHQKLASSLVLMVQNSSNLGIGGHAAIDTNDMATQPLDPQQMLKRKQDHINSFKAALDSDDDVPDPGRQASMAAVKKSQLRRRQRSSNESGSNGLPRSASDTNLVGKDRIPATNAQFDQSPPSSSAGNARLPASLMTRHTFSESPNKAVKAPKKAAAAKPSTTTKTIGKRKRGEAIPAVPEEQQIFKGLVFYFFPNDDINPARKLRIGKAREFGAMWQKNYNESVTHIIVDKAMDFALLMKYLKLETLPASTVVVSESYPADCISFRMMIDPKLPQFRVKGHELGTKKATASSDVSLPLKPAGKWVMARQPETQTSDKRAPTPPIDESSDEDDGLQMKAGPSKAQVPANEPATSTDFEAAVKQARGLQHIPLDDEEGDSRPTSSSGLASGSAVEQSPPKKGKLSMQDRFQCMKPSGPSNSANP